MTQTSKITTQICKDELKRFPNIGNLTLAKKIYKDNPTCFKDVEHVRSLIRNLKGANGAVMRSHAHKEFRKEFEALKKELPKGETERIEPYVLPKANKNVLIISDLHMPYHDDDALFAALEYGHEQNVDTIIINGDLFDFSQISRHEKDPRKRSVKYELDCVKAF